MATANPISLISSPQPSTTPSKTVRPRTTRSNKGRRGRLDNAYAVLDKLSLEQLDEVLEHLDGNFCAGRNLPIARAIGKLPEDIREALYGLVERFEHVMFDDNADSDEKVCEALTLIYALKPESVASKNKLSRIALGLETTTNEYLGGIENIH